MSERLLFCLELKKCSINYSSQKNYLGGYKKTTTTLLTLKNASTFQLLHKRHLKTRNYCETGDKLSPRRVYSLVGNKKKLECPHKVRLYFKLSKISFFKDIINKNAGIKYVTFYTAFLNRISPTLFFSFCIMYQIIQT